MVDGVWRDGNVLVIRRGVRLPRRCAVCGEPVEGKMNLVTLRVGAGIYFDAAGLGARLAEDSTRVRFGHCREHAPWMRAGSAKVLGIAGCCVGPAAVIFSVFAFQDDMLAVAVPLAVVGVAGVMAMVTTMKWESPIKLIALDDRYARLSGFGEGYLGPIEDFDVARDRANADVAANLERMDGPDE
jgi:hypothetical protein